MNTSVLKTDWLSHEFGKSRVSYKSKQFVDYCQFRYGLVEAQKY